MEKSITITHNPYKEQSIKFFVDREARYIYRDGKVYTEEEINEAYKKTFEHDKEMGRKDRLVGYYDKWYRYNRADQGYAYDQGVKEALNDPTCAEEMHIIPCN